MKVVTFGEIMVRLALEPGHSVEIDGKAYTGEFLRPGIKYRFIIHE